MQIVRWHNYPDSVALERAAADWITASANAAIASRCAFHIVLAGGNTPRGIYQKLASINNDWLRWHIYYGDERCLAIGHADRNSTMATETWLKHVSVPASQIYEIPVELGPETAAQNYTHLLQSIAMFDLCLLGLGEDGHTASLFPGQDWGSDDNAPAALPVNHAPKTPSQRVTLSAQRLSLSREVLVCVTGESKQAALASWQAGEALPISGIQPETGLDVLVSK